LTLWDAPFQKPVRILDFVGLEMEVRLVLQQLGIDLGETIEKVHSAPLGDPVGLRIGEQVFTLRSDLCRKILVGCE
jgi:Fe2+ transport system protein FeoA